MKTFIISIFLIFISVFFFSCKGEKSTNENSGFLGLNIDSWVNDSIKIIERKYNDLVLSYKDSIYKSVDINNLPIIKSKKTGQVLTNDLRKILLTADSSYYKELAFYDFPEIMEFNSVPYSLYLAQKYNIASAYAEIYYYYYRLSYINSKLEHYSSNRNENIDLAYLDENQRNIAIWSLLKAYTLGDSSVSITLSNYFKKGIYLPSNNEIAKYLELKYNNRK